MKKNKSTFIMILFFFIGLIILFYPSLSSYTNEKKQSKVIDNYEKLLSNIEKEDFSPMFDKAHDYNEKLMKLNFPLAEYKKLGSTKDILNLNGNGMIGYISIDKLKLELPIHYGTTPQILNTSVGLLEGSSYPVGGESTHSVLSAHRGLPSSKLFTDLDKIELDDIFVIKILDQIFTYQVDHITVVKPDELGDIQITKGMDYVTLMTCTPYGINSHRLLVRGKRIENIPERKYVSNEGFKVNKLMVTPIVFVPILFIWLITILFEPVDKKIDWKLRFLYPTEYNMIEVNKKRFRIKMKEKSLKKGKKK